MIITKYIKLLHNIIAYKFIKFIKFMDQRGDKLEFNYYNFITLLFLINFYYQSTLQTICCTSYLITSNTLQKYHQNKQMSQLSNQLSNNNQLQHQLHKYEQQQPQQHQQLEQVKIYLRQANKKTSIIYLQQQASTTQLYNLACQKTALELDKIFLFVHGKKIQNNNTVIWLQNNDIIHVHNLSKIIQGNIKILLKPYQCQYQKYGSKNVDVKAGNKVGKQLATYLQLSQGLIFIQSGRKLDLGRTFQEQLVENQSTVLFTDLYYKNLPQEQKSKKQLLPLIPIIPIPSLQKRLSLPHLPSLSPLPLLPSSELRDIKEMNHRPMLRKSVTWSQTDKPPINFARLSFKKKQKPSIYKSQKISQGKQIWESDSSGDLQRNLRKKLAVRKSNKDISHSIELYDYNKENQIRRDGIQNHMNVSDEDQDEYDDDIGDFNQDRPLFSSYQRTELQKQFKKILFLDGPEQSKQQKQQNEQKQEKQQNNEVPQKCSIDFLQETEQFQIGVTENQEQQKEQNQINNKNQYNKKSNTIRKSNSMNLTSSIGKSRGDFVVPTRDFQLTKNHDDDDDDQEEEEFDD